jgi:carboxypeptidase Q
MKITFWFAIILIFSATLLHAQNSDRLDTAVVSKMKKAAFERPELMQTLSMLTDVYGPRLTNSSNFDKAARYAKSVFDSMGLSNVYFDQWDEPFGKGWGLWDFSLKCVSPVFFSVDASAKAWSPGLKNTTEAEAIYLDVRSESDVEKYKGKLKGKFVLFGLPIPLKPGTKPNATRLTDSTLLTLANSPTSEIAMRRPPPLEPQRLAYAKWKLCLEEGAIAVIEPSIRTKDGIITVNMATVPYPAETPPGKRLRPYHENAPEILPQVIVSAEHYNRLVRQLEKKVPVKLALTMKTAFTKSSPGYNVIAEIPGTDLRNEVVMIGAHLDSWHGATGTTDNAVGCAVMIEAMRLIKSLGVSPRRTIRIALWDGEEQGLLGSQNYVKRNLGQRLDKRFPYDSISYKSEAKNFSVYFNMDLGTGKYRGIYLQGNEKALPIFREWFVPFVKSGASTITLKNLTGTDHISFDNIGLPAFQFIQDPIEYGTTTYHSTMDTFDKASEQDLRHNVWITAVFAWAAANRDELFPRK